MSRERFAATPVDQLVKGSICPAWWEDKLSRHIGNIGHIGHIGYICLTFVRCVISNMPGLVRKHTVQCLLILGWHVGIGHTVGTGVAQKIVQWTTTFLPCNAYLYLGDTLRNSYLKWTQFHLKSKEQRRQMLPKVCDRQNVAGSMLPITFCWLVG